MQAKSIEPKFYSVQDLAEALDLTTGRIRQRLLAGEIIGEKFGRDWMIQPAEFRRQIRLHEKHGKWARR